MYRMYRLRINGFLSAEYWTFQDALKLMRAMPYMDTWTDPKKPRRMEKPLIEVLAPTGDRPDDPATFHVVYTDHRS